ncbi:MAG: discoidin domain-containing protein, partial [Clostridia bacterium]|nr:discoidin domain-containing protein [Clostridia bacterium]
VYGTFLDLSLSTLAVSAGELSPAFDPAVMTYEVTVPSLDAIPQVTATPSNSNAAVVITQADATTKKATVTVSFGEGLPSLTYTINIVLDLKLATLTANAGVLSPSFDPDVTEYELALPSLDTMPEITATASDSSATVAITQADITTKKATVTVTAADGSDSLIYTITMVKQETNFALAVNGGKATSPAGYSNKGAGQAIDGDITTVWHPNPNSYDEVGTAWFKVELSDVILVKKIIIYEGYSNNKDAMYSNLFASLDGENWTQLSCQMEKTEAVGMSNGRKRVFTLNTPTGAKFVKMVNPLTGTITMTEFEVYGEPIDLKLKELTFSEGTLSPAFTPGTILYECALPSLEAMPVVTTATANNPEAQVEILNATTATKQAKVKVSLGEYYLTYTINMLQQEKNWALAENGTTLTSSRTYTTTGVKNAVDGSKSTNWQSNLEKPDREYAWFQAEFQDVLCVTRVVVYDKTSNGNGNTMKLQYSFDGKTYYDLPCEETRTTDITTSNGRKRVFAVTEPVGAKYLKVVNPKAGNYFISEFEVNGYLINPYLRSLQSSIGELSPSFNRKVVSYDLVIASKDVLPTISATADDENAQVELIQADLNTMEAKVLVTTAGEECTMPYTIRILYPPDNVELEYLTISSGKLEPSFDLSTESYSVTLGPDDEIPVVMAGALFPEVTNVEITQATDENGLLAKVEVGSGNGLFTKTYTIQFNRTGVDLNTLTVGTKELNPAFSPDVLDYSVILEADEALPEVAITIDYALASQTITQATESTMKATVKLVSLEGEEQVYTVYFYRRNNAADNANLSGIKFSSGSLYEVFDPARTEFSYIATDEMNLPIISEAVTEATGATAVITQADNKTMTATIVVTSANGNVTKTYKVYYLTNLALGRETYSSSAYSPTKPVRATDGIYKTYWGASNGNVKEWIVCYLENKGTIRHMRVHENCSGEVENNYFNHILKSDDGRNWTEVETTMTVSSFPGREGLKEYYILEYDFEPFEARYVKITGDDCSRVRLNEIELFGVWEEIISTNAYLKSLELSNATLTPAFTSYLMDYTVNLGKNEPLPTITKAESVDPAATVTITDATEEMPQAQVQVLAEDGVTKRTYSIMMNKEVDPEKDTRLSSISTSKGILEPAFSQNILRYTLYLHPGDVLAEISGQTVTKDASLEIIKTASEAKLVVISADGTAQRNYVIAIVYVNAELGTLEVPGAVLTPAFDPGVYEYKAELPAGSAIPDVNANPADAEAFLSITPATEQNMTTIIEVKGAGTSLVKTYKITFSRRQSFLEGVEAAMEAVKNYQVSETTTAAAMMATIRSSITNGDISLTWHQPFQNQVPTTTNQGLVAGQITIALGGESAVIKINKPYGTLLPGAITPAGGGGGSSGGVYNAAVSVTPGDVLGTTEVESGILKNELAGHWAEKEITVLYEKGIVKGNGQSLDLESKVSRAEFVSMLVRASGLEKVAYQGIFSDVDKSKWYADDVQMAYNKGLVSGYGDQFGPEDEMSREQASKTLLSFYEMLYGKSEEATVSTFTDAHAVSQWAQESVNRSAALGLIQGYPDNSFRPMAPLTRAQAMVLVYRLCRF